MTANRRNLRLKEILDIVSATNVYSQAELQKVLSGRGFEVTQASLSRDLKTLGIRKSRVRQDDGRYITSPQESLSRGNTHRNEASLARRVISVAKSDNILVIKTRSGYASSLAYDIDLLSDPGILGTIAGGDTVFAIIAPGITPATLSSILAPLIPTKLIPQ